MLYCMLYAVRVARYLGGGSCMRCVSSCLESSLADGDTLQPLAWLLCFGTLISWGASSASLPAAGHGQDCEPFEGAVATPWPWEMTFAPLATTRGALAVGAGVGGIIWPPAGARLAEGAVASSVALEHGLIAATAMSFAAVLFVRYSPAVVYRIFACGRAPREGSVTRKMTGWVVSAVCMLLVTPVLIATIRPAAVLPMKSGTLLLGGCGASAAQGAWLVQAASYVAAMTVGVPVCACAAFACSARLPFSLRRLVC
jgi:hypothetical protein